MDLNLKVTIISTAATCIAAVGTIAAAYAAFLSRATSRDALHLQKNIVASEQDRLTKEWLRNYAIKANSYAEGKQGSDWKYSDGANIVFNLNSAMKLISQLEPSFSTKKIINLKRFFCDQLCIELVKELNGGVGPDALFAGDNSSHIEMDVYTLWEEVVEFFGFLHVTDADLSD
jgi:hypothetical protein